MQSVVLSTSDGHRLAGDLARPAAQPPGGDGRRPGVVLCHPHPRLGGDRFGPMVDALYRHLPTRGFTVLRFDFRSDVAGTGVRRDVVAIATDDERARSIVAIAPPLTAMRVPAPVVPTLVLAPQHDQFTPPDAAAPIVAAWPDGELRTIEAVDHFLHGGAADRIARITADWLYTR